MAFVITELCTRDGACVEVCPVDCIVPGPKGSDEWPYFYIDPEICINCGACAAVCPSEAIYPEEDVPAKLQADIERNRRFFTDGPGYRKYDLEAERER